ncbi:membrane integrity-associated transporter subunit PqiC [Phragmitibacter flavus]|uniref:Membrane integrity-associated transporter subunit PqiC n=1 Tax=Phragmitibacter flavus TaxID=2576071 RepID=A0A5R8KKC4_9BACT|nr:PqiC family protein [Phragmitibacter flavus]TLD72395.1 membrane integrity-associated transporter subunit PqiC [Phragmitibacter flavus]
MNRFLPALIALFLASCSAPGKSFYVLSPEGPAPSGGGRGIGVGPVTIAGYLDRPNIVFKQSDHQLAIAESNRWAGDLGENITRVLATNLGRQLNTGNVRTYPWTGDEGLQYQVTLDIRSLHGTPEGDAFIEASWRIYSLPNRSIISTRTWSGTETLASDGYDALVAAESRLLATLAREIAASIR